MGEVNKAMGARLMKLRLDMGVCRTEVCEALKKKYNRKLGFVDLMDYEDNGIVPDAEVLVDLADFYGVTVSQIMIEEKVRNDYSVWGKHIDGTPRCRKCDKNALYIRIDSAHAQIFRPFRSSFCPYCGAAMDGWDDEKRLEVKISKTFI